MGDIGRYNYAGFTLEQKHAWFQSGPGSTAATQVSDSLKRIAARLDVSDGTIGAGFIERQLGSSWRGSAAREASGAFDQAAIVLASLATSGGTGGGSAQQFGDSFNATKNAIPQPETQNWLSSAVGDSVAVAVGGMWAAQTDARATQVANQNADLAANDALTRHEETTRQALASYRVAAASAQPKAPGVGAQPSARIAGGGGAAGAGARGGGQTGAGGAGAAAGGAAAAGAGHTGSAAGGTTSAGSGSGSHGGTAAAPGTEAAGWTPLNPSPSGTPSAPNGGYLPNGPNGGYLPTGPNGGYFPNGPGGAYLPAPSPPPPWQRSASSNGGSDSGYPNTGQPLPPRTGEVTHGGGGQPATAATAARGQAQGAMAPIGAGGAGAAGRGRDHRNQCFIPEDEPFRVDYDFYVAPPVIGAGAPDYHQDQR